MHTNPRPTIAVIVLLLAAVAVLGGCDERIKELEMKNRALSERLERVKGEKAQLQAENQNLSATLASQQGIVDAKDARIMQLNTQIGQLEAALLEVKNRYDEAMETRGGIVAGPLPQGLSDELAKFAAENPDIAEFDSKYGMVKLKSDFTFPPGSAQPKPEAIETLKRLVEILKTPEAREFAVYIAGHTDDMPISRPETKRKHPTNWYLSAHRAIGVQFELAQAGLAPERIAVMGFGEYHPVVPNNPNQKGAQANRRVEIWIVPRGAFLTTEADR
jgi:chemotaxis protein MotB